MLINKNTYGYSRNKRHVTGKGFVDSLSSIFNSLKASAIPTIRSVGSYVSDNKDLIAKPLLGAVGSLAATGLTAGVPALIGHIMSRNRSRPNQPIDPKLMEDPKYKEILQSIIGQPPVSNIIGSGIKRF